MVSTFWLILLQIYHRYDVCFRFVAYVLDRHIAVLLKTRHREYKFMSRSRADEFFQEMLFLQNISIKPLCESIPEMFHSLGIEGTNLLLR